MDTTIKPTEITHDVESNIQYASFDYYSGIKFANINNLKQTTSFKDVDKFTHFLVCCGDVMVRVNPTDYPEIERRII